MISILLSVHNNTDGRLIKTLESIASQTYREWELVAVDDASQDDTEECLVEFQKRYPKQVTLLKNTENAGLTKSLILAAKHAHGTYIARIDSGDEFLPEKLEKQVFFLDQHPQYGIVGCYYTDIFYPGRRAADRRVPVSDIEIRRAIVRRNPFAHSAILMRSDVYKKVGGYDASIRYGQDYDLWFRILRVAKGANLPEFLCVRSIYQDSISYEKQKDQMRQCLKTQWKYMNKHHVMHYAYLLEPFLLAVLPVKLLRWMRALTSESFFE